ncbi:MAG: hypothetical protein AAGK66_08925 [Pseudomonadota bacterium]
MPDLSDIPPRLADLVASMPDEQQPLLAQMYRCGRASGREELADQLIREVQNITDTLRAEMQE